MKKKNLKRNENKKMDEVLGLIVKTSTYFILGVMTLMFIFVVGYFIAEAVKSKKRKKQNDENKKDDGDKE